MNVLQDVGHFYQETLQCNGKDICSGHGCYYACKAAVVSMVIVQVSLCREEEVTTHCCGLG